MKFLRVIPLFVGIVLLPSIGSASQQTELANWLNQVVIQHPRMQAAQAATEKAKAEVRAADQPLFNPEIEFEYESTDVDTKTAGITQTIDWGDKQSAQTHIAELRWQSSLNALTVQQQQLTADVLLALTNYHASTEGQRVAKKQFDSMAKFFSISKQRYDAGDLTEVDLALAQLANSEASFQLADASSNLITREQALYVLLGDESEALLASAPNIQTVPPNTEYAASNKDRLLGNLPQMKLALTQMNIARAKIKLRQREQRPNPTIGIKAGKEGEESLTNVTLSVPLFVRNSYRAEVDAANAELIQRQREAIDTRRILVANITTSAKTLQLNRDTWAQWQNLGSRSLLQQEKLLEKLWRAGELSTPDYLVQIKQALDTQASAIVHKTQLWQSWAQWLIASGEINQWITSVNGGEK